MVSAWGLRCNDTICKNIGNTIHPKWDCTALCITEHIYCTAPGKAYDQRKGNKLIPFFPCSPAPKYIHDQC